MLTAAGQEGEVLLEQAQKLLSQVILNSGSVKAFLVRWKMLSSKLEQLSGQLIELGGLPFHSKNTLCREMLESLVSSLQESLVLASECLTQDYGGGKLQMQSRLDSLGNLLDGFLHDSRLMIDSGVLRQTLPLTPVNVTSVSNKESKKWTVKDLLARLQMGSSESRVKALDSLVEFMSEDDKNVLLVAAAPGGISALVHLLDARVPVMREKAAAAISTLVTVESCVHQIVSEGALQSLVRLLDPARGSFASERAAKALQSLTAMVDNARAVAAHGGISPLLELCRSGTPVSQAASAGVLRNLAAVEEIRGRIAEEDEGVQVLVHLLSSGTPVSRDHAAVTLQKLASNDDGVRRVLIWNEVLEALARFLDAAEATASLEAGLGLLGSLAEWSESVPVILEAGFLPQLAGFLSHSTLSVQQAAAGVVGEIAGVSLENRRVVGEAGCIGPLVRMLQAKTMAAQKEAMVVLVKLVEVESNRRVLVGDENGIEAIVRVLESGSGSPELVESGVAALGILAGSSRNRKQMVACGACSQLRRAVEMEISGARKLVERLEGGRLRSFLKKKLDI